MSPIPLRIVPAEAPAAARPATAAAAALGTPQLAAVPPGRPGTPRAADPTGGGRSSGPRRALQLLRSQALALLLGACSLGTLLLIWHLATTYRWDFYIRFTNLPTPLEVAQQLGKAMDSTKFMHNVGMSLRRIAIGFAVASLLGVGLGLAIGRYKLLRQLMFPAIEALRPIPAIAWVPISIMLWPDNEVSIVFITFIGAFFPILLNTVAGVQAVDAVLLRAGQCLGAREPQLMWHVVLPGAAPQVFTGLAVGMGVAWVSLIAAEMISGQFGVGYFTWEAYSLISYADIVLGMITIGVLGLGCSWLIRAASRWALPWLVYSKPGSQA
ncbi:ABC transporter permease [Aquabacterium sp. OR-4]|uniref:ABC transporter permease n=1 Tax=Aquabacterium sp. OR-4 TaxID=2978127 RepID=UPI0021B22C19|nr:ABC transporter permease [Aquabacterium sp. OR-4]MDT7834535.1 ABC transporter permease [Aquabacterium sp. OR-4]